MARRAHIAASYALQIGTGLIGLATLLWATVAYPFSQPGLIMFAFWGLGTMTRVMAFPLYRGKVIAFDSAYLISAGVVLGWVPGAWVVIATMATDLLAQRFRRRIFDLPQLSSWEWFSRAMFATFGNALLLLAAGALLSALGLSPEHTNRHTAVFFSTPVALLAFVIGHYHIALLAAVLQGQPLGKVYRRMTVPGIFGEALLIPLAMVMVLVYQDSDPSPFALLAVTVLVINAGFFFAAVLGQRLQARLRDLSVLNAMSRALARRLEIDPLLSEISRQLLKHFPSATSVVVGLRDLTTGVISCTLFGAGAQRLERNLPPDRGLGGKVIAERRPIRLRDLGRQRLEELPDLIQPELGSWLGVPMLVNEDASGYINLQSDQRNAFSRGDVQLLSQIAAQVAMATETARLFRLATVDGLTGLFVRRYFDQRMDEECARAQRFGSVFSLLMLDLDDFKFINDTRGHQVGDEVLRATARVVRRDLRALDIAARYGGEEFVVLLPRTHIMEARRVAERIREGIAETPVATDAGEIKVTISIGVATFPDHATEPHRLLRCADAALYRAKQGGKNQVATAPAVTPDST